MVLRKIAAPGATSRETTPTPRPVLELTDAELHAASESEVEDAVTTVEPLPPAPPPPPVPPARAIAQSHSSVPPMVATVITPISTVLDPPVGVRLAASWRGVLGGATLGLAIVTAFVVGAHLVHSSGSHPPAAAETAQPTTPAIAAQRVTSPAVAPPETTNAAPVLPVIAATSLPTAAQPVRRAPRAAQPASPAAPPAAAQPAAVASAEPSSPPPTPTPTAAAAATPAASTASAQPPPDDSAQSLVPVIPASTAVVDPLVKAVQDDIDEEQSAHRK
jgi:hypothetical protein